MEGKWKMIEYIYFMKNYIEPIVEINKKLIQKYEQTAKGKRIKKSINIHNKERNKSKWRNKQ